MAKLMFSWMYGLAHLLTGTKRQAVLIRQARDKQQQLLAAAQEQNMLAVQHLLDTGVDVSARDEDNCTALHMAAAAVHVPMVTALLAAGADASATDKKGLTPLDYLIKGVSHPHDGWVAIKRRTYASRIMLLAAPTTRGVHHCGPHCAGAAGLVKPLFAAAVQVVVCRSDYHVAPLHAAAETGCSALVGSLLQAGADASYFTQTFHSALHAAASSGNLEVVQQVLEAAGSKASSMLRYLACRRDMDQYQNVYSTPLHLAAEGGHLEVVEVLVAAGANKDKQDSQGSTALHRALLAGHASLVPLLVTPGNVNTPCTSNMDRAAPLHLAAACASKPVRDHHGKLVLPAAHVVADAVAHLLAAGADSSARDSRGRTAVGVAAGEIPPEPLQVLLRHLLQQHQQQQLSHNRLMEVLREAAEETEEQAHNSHLAMLVTMVADALGEQGVRSLWQTCLPGQDPAARWQSRWARDAPHVVVGACGRIWASSWHHLAAQRSRITGRLQKLVISPERQQEQEEQHGPVASGIPGEQMANRPGLQKQLKQLAIGLSKAAVAAAERGYLGLSMQHLQELALVDVSRAEKQCRWYTGQLPGSSSGCWTSRRQWKCWREVHEGYLRSRGSDSRRQLLWLLLRCVTSW
jgi:ankyrin repeat protein